jgi:hypothetical protein
MSPKAIPAVPRWTLRRVIVSILVTPLVVACGDERPTPSEANGTADGSGETIVAVADTSDEGKDIDTTAQIAPRVQNASTACVLRVSPGVFWIDPAGGVARFTVTANRPSAQCDELRLVSIEDWVTAPIGYQRGSTTIDVRVRPTTEWERNRQAQVRIETRRNGQVRNQGTVLIRQRPIGSTAPTLSASSLSTNAPDTTFVLRINAGDRVATVIAEGVPSATPNFAGAATVLNHGVAAGARDVQIRARNPNTSAGFSARLFLYAGPVGGDVASFQRVATLNIVGAIPSGPPSVSPVAVTAPFVDGTVGIQVIAVQPTDRYSVGDPSEPWMRRLTEATVTGSSTVALRLNENLAREARSGTIVIAGTRVTITQEGRPSALYVVSPANASVESRGGTVAINVNVDDGYTWTVGKPTAEWITTRTNGGAGRGTVDLVVAPNFSNEPRIAQVRVALTTVLVRQDPAQPISISSRQISVNAGRNVVRVSVNAQPGQEWICEGRLAEWISTSGQRGTGPGFIDITVLANGSSGARTTYFFIANNRVDIQQSGTNAQPLIVTPASFALGTGGAELNVNVTMGLPTAPARYGGTDESWLRPINSTLSQSGLLRVSVDYNPAQPRAALFSVTDNSGARRWVTVTQDGLYGSATRPVAGVSFQKWHEVPSSQNLLRVFITAPTTVCWSVVGQGSGWARGTGSLRTCGNGWVEISLSGVGNDAKGAMFNVAGHWLTVVKNP